MLFLNRLLLGFAAFAVIAANASTTTGSTSLFVGLKQRNLDKLEQIVYGATVGEEHMSRSDILDMIAPPRKVAKAVRAYVQGYVKAFKGHYPVCDIRGRDYVVCNADSTHDIQFAARVVHTFFDERYVDLVVVQHKNKTTITTTNSHEKTKTMSDELFVAPQTLRALYNMSDAPFKQGSSVGPVEFQGDMAVTNADLSQFVRGANVSTPAVFAHVIGPYFNQTSDVESALDVDVQLGLTPNATRWYWTESEWMLDFATNLFGMPEPVPEVLTISWGWSESKQCDIDPNCGSETSKAYATRVNNEFLKIAARGITLVAASGDAGSPSRTNENCNANPMLNPIFPGGSPNVLSVGGTVLDPKHPGQKLNSTDDAPPVCDSYACSNGVHARETFCSMASNDCPFTAGGGFSNFFPTPSYQRATVESYLQKSHLLPPAFMFNRNGRGYPDVSALSHNYLTAVGRSWMSVDGTSASTPVWGAVIAHLNEALKNITGKSNARIGLANRVLYKMAANCPKCFNKVTGFAYNGCTEAMCCQHGYTGRSDGGWDAVTGLGTPNVGRMIDWLKQKHKSNTFCPV